MPKKKAAAAKSKAKKSASGAKSKRSAKRQHQLAIKPPEYIPPNSEEDGRKHQGGRPSEYTAETAAKICERLVNGESLRSICRDREMPDAVTVFRWMEKHPEFRKQYVHAREMQAELLAEEIIEIADTERIGLRRKMTPRGPELIESDGVERSKLMVDARKWAAARLLPKRYGDRPVDDASKPNEQLEAMIAALNAGPVPPGEVNE